MNDNTPLLRQVIPEWVHCGKISSQAFRPFRKGEMLSTYDGSIITAEEAYFNFTGNPDRRSAGVASVLVSQFKAEGLEIIEDRIPYESHISVSYDIFGTNAREKISRKLANIANARGWAYIPVKS